MYLIDIIKLFLQHFVSPLSDRMTPVQTVFTGGN